MTVQVHTYDAETGRTGGGTFNTATKSGTQRVARQRLLPEPSEVGHGAATSSRARRRPLPDTYFHLGGGGFGGPIIQQPHVLLVLGRRLRLQHHAQRQRCGCRPTREKAGRLLADASTPRGALRGHLRSAHRRRQRQRPPAVPRQHHSRQPHQPGGAGKMLELPADRRLATSATATRTATASPRSTTAR